MNMTSRAIIFSLASILAIAMANAFGYFGRDSDVFGFMGMPNFGMFVGLGIVVMLAFLFLLVFWLWMVVDCLKRDFKKDVEKIVWVLVLIFLHLLGAMIYYFVVKIQDKSATVVKKKR